MPEKAPSCSAILELLDVMRTLRSPSGCPWDAQQTATSLAPYILEEAAEVVDAIESQNPAAIMDEAGDLLLQVVFLAQIFNEQDLFDFSDVANGIAKKLIRRHPHVFGDNPDRLTNEELDHQWERIKRAEKTTPHADSHPFGQIPVNLPALQRAGKLLDRATKAGLLEQLVQDDDIAPMTEAELGRELFQLTARARRSGLDAEQALRHHIRSLIHATHSHISS